MDNSGSRSELEEKGGVGMESEPALKAVDEGHDSDPEGQLEEVDPVAEARLVRKLDLWIVPTVMLLYLFSFLDR